MFDVLNSVNDMIGEKIKLVFIRQQEVSATGITGNCSLRFTPTSPKLNWDLWLSGQSRVWRPSERPGSSNNADRP